MGEMVSKRLHVEVSDDMILDGERGNCEACPVALGIVASHSSIKHADVTTEDPGEAVCASFVCEGLLYRFLPLPEAVVAFVHAFDNYGAPGVEPFEFDLELLDERVVRER